MNFLTFSSFDSYEPSNTIMNCIAYGLTKKENSISIVLKNFGNNRRIKIEYFALYLYKKITE